MAIVNQEFLLQTIVESELYPLILEERDNRQHQLSLIASENIASFDAIAAVASTLLGRNYFGYPEDVVSRNDPFYQGHQSASAVYNVACGNLTDIFGCSAANVQPLSGTTANRSVIAALDAYLGKKAVIMSKGFETGGHFSHQSADGRQSYSSPCAENGGIDYEGMEVAALKYRPDVIIVGGSAEARDVDYARVRGIADSVGAMVWADIAQISGLVAAGVLKNPFDYGVDIATTSTHKTIAGVRAGAVMCNGTPELSRAINDAVSPLIQGEPNIGIIAANLLTFKIAKTPEFKVYAEDVVSNAQAMAQVLSKSGVPVLSGGTDNHMVMIDLRRYPEHVTGKELATHLERANILANQQGVPSDPRYEQGTAGLRIGTAAATNRGLQEKDFRQLATAMAVVIRSYAGEISLPLEEALQKTKSLVETITDRNPAQVYPLEMLERATVVEPTYYAQIRALEDQNADLRSALQAMLENTPMPDEKKAELQALLEMSESGKVKSEARKEVWDGHPLRSHAEKGWKAMAKKHEEPSLDDYEIAVFCHNCADMPITIPETMNYAGVPSPDDPLMVAYAGERFKTFEQFHGAVGYSPDGPKMSDQADNAVHLVIMRDMKPGEEEQAVNGKIIVGGRRMFVNFPGIDPSRQVPVVDNATVAEHLSEALGPVTDTKHIRLTGLFLGDELRGVNLPKEDDIPKKMSEWFYEQTLSFCNQQEVDFIYSDVVEHNLARISNAAHDNQMQQVHTFPDAAAILTQSKDGNTLFVPIVFSSKSRDEKPLLTPEQIAKGIGSPPVDVEMETLLSQARSQARAH